MLKTFGGDRKIALVRELTKIHEEVKRCTIDEAIAYYSGNNPRGEYVLVVEGAKEVEETEDYVLPEETTGFSMGDILGAALKEENDNDEA